MFMQNSISRRLSLAAALLLAPLATLAQAPQSPPIHGLAHIAVRVNDVAASRAFYEKLGYLQAFAFEKNGAVSQSFLKVNDRQFIELYPKPAQPGNQPSGEPVQGFLHLCFDGDDLTALHDFDVAQGLPANPVRKAGAGNLLFTLRGPENQNIEYTQYMPGSLHYEDRGKHLGGDRIADGFFAVGLGMKDVPAAAAYYTGRLGFSTAPGSKTLLLIPGSSDPASKDPGTSGAIAAQQILLQPLTSPASRIFLYVPDLKKAAAELKERGIAFQPAKRTLTVTDPDGNFLVFTTEKTAA
jgi:catechol 2,3-dioxygenase-like lactoylglutathione lyase family enzyme